MVTASETWQGGSQQNGAATVEKSMEFPQKTNNGTAFDSAVASLTTKNPKSLMQNNLCSIIYNSQVLEATYPCSSVVEGSKNCGTFTQWNTMQQKKEGAPTLRDNMDGTGEHYAK